ncbi:hypothetical protein VWM74_10605, partial [Campylobacter jejuni]
NPVKNDDGKIYKVIKFATDISEQVKKDQEKLCLISELAEKNDTGTTQFYTTSKNAVEVTEKGVDAGSLFNAKGQGLNLRDG